MARAAGTRAIGIASMLADRQTSWPPAPTRSPTPWRSGSIGRSGSCSSTARPAPRRSEVVARSDLAPGTILVVEQYVILAEAKKKTVRQPRRALPGLPTAV